MAARTARRARSEADIARLPRLPDFSVAARLADPLQFGLHRFHLREQVALPIYAIGGLTPGDIPEARRHGELTVDDINALWMSVQAESLGDAFEFMPGYETFWTYVPHFVHSPFYVYAYAFGDGLVNALYAAYEAQPEGFQAKYFDMLRAGGSKHHSELLEPFGLDAADPAFWDKGLSMIEGFIDELEAMEA